MTRPASGPTPLAILSARYPGQLLLAMRRDPLRFLADAAERCGDFVRFELGSKPIFVVGHPDLVRQVLVDENASFAKGRALRRARAWLGDGLLTNDGPTHLRQRRLIQPAFLRTNVRSHLTPIVAAAGRRQRLWRDGVEVDIGAEMMQITLQVVFETLFGKAASQALDDIGAHEVGDALDVMIEMTRRLVLPLGGMFLYLPSPLTIRYHRARRRLDRMLFRLIEQRRHSGARGDDVLSRLLDARDESGDGPAMDARQLRDEAVTIFLAAYETSANALMWTWFLLARHPEVACRLQAEIDAVLGQRALTADDLPRLPFTESVVAESMRLYPPVWAISREARVDVTIGEKVIPRGAIVIVSVWNLHRDRRFWSDPERFEPQRFAPALAALRPRGSYLPFGDGPRKCIGEPFAWVEMIAILATLAQQIRVERIDDAEPRLRPFLVLRPEAPLRLRIHRRHPAAREAPGRAASAVRHL